MDLEAARRAVLAAVRGTRAADLPRLLHWMRNTLQFHRHAAAKHLVADEDRKCGSFAAEQKDDMETPDKNLEGSLRIL